LKELLGLMISLPHAELSSESRKRLSRLVSTLRKIGATSIIQRIDIVSESLDFFTPSSVVTFLDPVGSSISYENEQGKYLARFNIIRNIFILLPVVFTWLGLTIAVSSYQKYVASHPSINKSFLELWQNGFGGTTGQSD
jgi:hypothetical protein